MATSKEMTAGPALPLIFNFTLPLLFGNLLQQTYSLVDAAIVGKFLGINALASVGASTSVVFLILGFCNGCCGGFGIPVAQLHEPGKDAQAGAGQCKARIRLYSAGLHSFPWDADCQCLGSRGHHPDSGAGAVPVCKGFGTAFADRPEGPAANQPQAEN